MMKRLFHMRRSKRSGFTLLELAIVLMVASVLLGSVWVAMGSMWDNYRVGRTTQQVTKITQNIREYYMNAQQLGSASGVDITTALDTLNLFPIEMRRNAAAGGPLDHPLSTSLATGSFHVTSMKCPGISTAPVCFRIRLQGLPQRLCERVLDAVPINDADLGIVQVGTANMAQGTTVVTTRLQPSTANTWCNLGGATNEVDWDFKLRN